MRDVALPMNDGKPFEIVCDAADRFAWLNERLKGIGSSDAATILGVNPWKTPLALYAEKIGLVDPPDESEAMLWGSRLEPLVLRRYEEVTERTVYPAQKLLRSRERPWQLATLDAEQTALSKPALGVLEVKCTGLRENWQDGVPPYVMAQVQHQMAVTGYVWASVAVLFNGREFLWADVERDEEYIARLTEAEDRFMARITNLDPPDPEASEVDKEILARLYAKESGAVISLDGEFVSLDERREELKAEKQRVEHELLYIENQIKAAMKDATTACLTSGVVFTLKEQHRKEFTVAATSFRVLRRKELR